LARLSVWPQRRRIRLTPRPQKPPSRGRRSALRPARITRATGWPSVPPPTARGCAAFSNGSQSSDADNDLLEFFWYADGQTNLLATGAVATVLLPIGPHTVTLVVGDSQHTATAEVNFEIITPGIAVGQIMLLVEEANLQHKQALLASLNAAQASFDRGHFNAAVHELDAFQDKVRAQVAKSDPELASELIADAQQIITVMSGP